MPNSLFFRLACIVVLLAIWILSFLPGSSMPSVPGTDKLHHALAYFALMFCWGQLFISPRPRLKLAITFVVMGALIECLQGLTTYRYFEWLDMLANAIGVAIAWTVVTVQLAVQRRFTPQADSAHRAD